MAAVKSHRFAAHWRLYTFEVTRRGAGNARTKAVPGRRVVVLAPTSGAALAGVGPHADEVVRPAAPRLGERLAARLPVPLQERADLFRILGSGLATGKSTVQALAMATRQTRSPRLRGAVGAVIEAVAHGEELHRAFGALPGDFPPAVVALAATAARSGLEDGGRLFVSLSERLGRDARLGRRLVAALAYPALLLTMALVAAGVLETVALPPMVELFRSMGAELPAMTAFLYRLAGAVEGHLPATAVVAASLLVAVVPLSRRVVRSAGFQRATLRVWGVGPVLLARALARALGTFLLLRRSGVPNREVFALAGAASGNAAVEDFFRDTYARVAQGESLEEAFLAERHRLGDEGIRLAGRIEAGLEGGDLPALLSEVVDDLTDRADARAAALPKLVELPILMVCGVIVGTLLLAMFLPYPSLLGDVARQMSAH